MINWYLCSFGFFFIFIPAVELVHMYALICHLSRFSFAKTLPVMLLRISESLLKVSLVNIPVKADAPRVSIPPSI